MQGLFPLQSTESHLGAPLALPGLFPAGMAAAGPGASQGSGAAPRRVGFRAASPAPCPRLLRRKRSEGECVPADPKHEHFSQKREKQSKKIVGESELLRMAYRCEERCLQRKWTFK